MKKFLSLLIAASMPILKVILMTAVGSILALDRIGILTEDATKHFTNVSFYLFSPALVMTSLARTVTLKTMATLWFLPLNIALTFIIGSAFGWVLIKITRAPRHLKGLILGCCASGNLGNMMLIIIPAICKEKNSPFGNPDACNSYGMTYASLSLAFGSICFWSYVYNIVRISSKTSASDNTNEDIETSRTAEIEAKMSEDMPPHGLTRSPPDDEHVEVLPSDASEQRAKGSFLFQCKKCLKMITGRINLKLLFAPSTIGAIIGFCIGVVPQIRKLLIGETAPLRVIQDSASLYGEGAIPTITLVVGGNLIKGLKGTDIRAPVIIGILTVRYILLPVFGILIVKGATHFGLIDADPLYRFVLMLQFTLPPAMNIGTITQLFGVGETESSVIMLWHYPLASISLTLWCILFMWLVT
ncbi:hypothetical protein Scep_008161 [Stephania cephalantha]|uniref:Uncharacterized protein n=1 Tax=Stephania cephalantha TaxID=152367 RepID=A0AAP0KD44_9MAGN